MKKAKGFSYEMPLRLYRRAEDIREDISELRGRIEEIKSSFSVREMLLELLSETRERSPYEWIYDLEALLGEAEGAYRRLGELREELCFLEAELGEARCAVSI